MAFAAACRKSLTIPGKLVELQRAGLRNVDEAVVDERLGLGPDRRGRHGRGAVLLQVDVRDAADMPELQEYPPALGVHGGRDLAPAVDLSLGVDAGRVLVTLSLLRDLRGLGNQQAGRRALAVILRGEIAWNEARASAIARQGRHDDTIGEGQRAESIGLKQRCARHRSPLFVPAAAGSFIEMASLVLRRPCGTARRDVRCR